MLPRAELLAVLDSSRQSERRNLRDYKPDVAQKKDAQVHGKREARPIGPTRTCANFSLPFTLEIIMTWLLKIFSSSNGRANISGLDTCFLNEGQDLNALLLAIWR